MKYWMNVCVEGHCFGEEDDDGKNPCGRTYPSPFCLTNDVCPHFAWSGTTERNVAQFIPVRIYLLDKLKNWWSSFCEDLKWDLYGKRKWEKEHGNMEEWLENIPVVTAEECPNLAKWEEEERVCATKFPKWFKKAYKEWVSERQLESEGLSAQE
jgi:hypothetical protein